MKFFVGFVSEYGNIVQFSKLFETKKEAEKQMEELTKNVFLDLLDFNIFCK